MLDEITGGSFNRENGICGVDLIEAHGKWPAEDENAEETLKGMSFKVTSGKVLAVIGHVGSGKVGLK